MADMKSALEKLGGLLGLSTGMAGKAAETISMRPYQLYVQEQQAQGLQPLTYEEWLKMQQPQEAPKSGILGR